MVRVVGFFFCFFQITVHKVTPCTITLQNDFHWRLHQAFGWRSLRSRAWDSHTIDRIKIWRKSLSPCVWETNQIYVDGRLTCSNSTPWHRLDRPLTKRDHKKNKNKTNKKRCSSFRVSNPIKFCWVSAEAPFFSLRVWTAGPPGLGARWGGVSLVRSSAIQAVCYMLPLHFSLSNTHLVPLKWRHCINNETQR